MNGGINKQRMKCQFHNKNFNKIAGFLDERKNIFLSFS